MRTVVELAAYLAAANRAGMSDDIRAEIALALSLNPELGDVMPGTGGARKFRWARRNEGKSGGFRVVTYYPGAERVYLIDVFAKNAKANLSAADRNDLKKLTAMLER
jgi:hypothetical protein